MIMQKGFSFTEIMVAILILVIGILPIFWFFSRSNVGTMKTRDEILAQHYAAELIDFVKAQGFASAEITSDDGKEMPEINVGGESIKVDDRFIRRLFVKQVTPEHNSEWPCTYKVVSVDVSWVIETQSRSLRLAGIIYAGRD